MNKNTLVITVLLVVAGLIGAGYYLWQAQDQADPNPRVSTTSTPSPTPTATEQASPSGETNGSTQPVEQTVNMYMVALEDNGVSGKKIGCGDSLVPVRQTLTTSTPLADILRRLLGYEEQYYGESGLYNALWQSDLTLESASIVDGEAQIELRGTVSLSGTCDTPRVEEQLTATATQFASVERVSIRLNGQPLREALSTQ
jgi:hypothetical protein